MQNMERFFGFRVAVNDDLDPENERTLKKMAQEFAISEEIDLSEYFVYLHQLVIRSNESHWGMAGGLSRRVTKLNMDFYVNEKQHKNKDIRFMNHIFQTGSLHEVKPYFTPDWIGYEIPSSYFERTAWFQNTIIAYVKKDMRNSHKKVKIVVTTTPTAEFQGVMRSRDTALKATNLDLKFRRNVQLNFPMDLNQTPHNQERTMNQFTNYGNVGAFGPNAVAQNFAQNQQLVSDLEQLKRKADEAGEKEDAENLEATLECMRSKRNTKAFDYIRKLGGWTLTTAQELGLEAAKDLIRSALAP